MELRALHNFLAVAREGTITRAAERLFLSQPALSKQMRELEAELGCTLFERGARQVELTPEGHLLRARAEEILSLTERAQTELSARGRLIGTLALAAGETSAIRLLAPVLRELLEENPGLSLRVHSGNAEDTALRLGQGLDDLGLLIEPFDAERYECLRLPAQNRWGLLLRADHPLAAHPAITPAQLTALPLFVSQQTRVDAIFSSWMGRSFGTLRIIGTYNLVTNAAFLVAEGLGAALVLEGLVAADRPDSRLVFRPLQPDLTVGVCLAWLRHRPLSRPAKALLDRLRG